MSASIRKPFGLDLMGWTNAGWGVCGFTSSFYAMYELNPGKQGLLLGAGIAHKVLAEIKTYLVMLKGAGELALLQDIQGFTASFNGYKKFTIDRYIRDINSSVGRTEKQIIAEFKVFDRDAAASSGGLFGAFLEPTSHMVIHQYAGRWYCRRERREGRENGGLPRTPTLSLSQEQ